MGILIEIKDKQQKDSLIFYSVPYTGFTELQPFSIGIDPINKLLFFFENTNISVEPKIILDLKDEEKIISNFGIPMRVVAIIIRQVSRCLREHNFPDNISFAG